MSDLNSYREVGVSQCGVGATRPQRTVNKGRLFCHNAITQLFNRYPLRYTAPWSMLATQKPRPQDSHNRSSEHTLLFPRDSPSAHFSALRSLAEVRPFELSEASQGKEPALTEASCLCAKKALHKIPRISPEPAARDNGTQPDLVHLCDKTDSRQPAG